MIQWSMIQWCHALLKWLWILTPLKRYLYLLHWRLSEEPARTMLQASRQALGVECRMPAALAGSTTLQPPITITIAEARPEPTQLKFNKECGTVAPTPTLVFLMWPLPYRACFLPCCRLCIQTVPKLRNLDNSKHWQEHILSAHTCTRYISK